MLSTSQPALISLQVPRAFASVQCWLESLGVSSVPTGSACYQDSGAWDPEKHQSGSESHGGEEAGLDLAQGPAWGAVGCNRCNALLCLPLQKYRPFKGPRLEKRSTNSYPLLQYNYYTKISLIQGYLT